MNKGVSIFYEFHEQGSPHIIAGIYEPDELTEEEMRKKLLVLMDKSEFHPRETIEYYNHKKVLAEYWLNNNVLTKEQKYTFSKFFPEALKPESLSSSPFKFVYYDADADKFIWRNRKNDEVNKFIGDLLRSNLVTRDRKRT